MDAGTRKEPVADQRSGYRLGLWGIGLAVAVLLLFWLGPRLSPPRFHGMVIQSPQPAADFELTSVSGQRRRLSDFRGQYVLLFFGYTYCPDVCPLTLAELARVHEQLGARADRVQVLFVSVDPRRDSLERLARYVTHFHDSFVGLTGNSQELMAASTPFGIYFERRSTGEDNDDYLVDHTGTVTVLDPDGYVRLVFPFGMTADQITADLKALMR